MPKTLKQKQSEAQERSQAHAERSIVEQLDLMDNRPGKSARERERLMKRLNEENTQPAKKRKKAA